MYIPSQKKWQTVIDKLYSILPLTFEAGDQHLDMRETQVNQWGHICGTVHCVGGWYAVAHWQEEALTNRVCLVYTKGANALAIDLGFEHSYYLEVWAEKYPFLWGNKNGAYMFTSKVAYRNTRTIVGIIKHFERVKYNCLVYEQKNKRATAP